MSGLILPGRQVFIVDTHVNLDPSAEQLAEITALAAEQLRAFGLAPKVALLSHSNFGSSDAPSALKMRAAAGAAARARCRIWKWTAKCMATSALDEAARKAVLPEFSTLHGSANLLVCPESRQRQHRLQPAEVRRRPQRRHRTDSARLRRAGAYSDSGGHRAAHRQHDRPHRGRGQSRPGEWQLGQDQDKSPICRT